MIRRDYLIVGAGVAGVSACESVREHDKKGTLMMVGNETTPAYHRPMLFKAVLGNGQAVEFRKALMATGSRARRPQVAGANLGNVFYLRSIRDVQALREV